ncbi:hypothetical protein GJ744_007494 [Endocarpon pusillum]|uniref:N-acetylglucosamine-induced protein 1 n=1 Tax=Endocarpon pusillum TaxID=364733 RepID=A0A8H7E448_9EURO|nr:hypothetical protein GJ744_007494 [Endocarpon pusillum]
MARPGSPSLGFITIPRGESVNDCPKSAIIISPKTERIICTREEDFRRWTWSEVKEAIRINRIDLFQRTPTDLIRYVEYVHYLKKTFGSVLHFIQHERLHWPSVQPSGQAPFENPTDYKILYNDWPYGIDLDIVHLVVWTKFELEDDVTTNDLSQESRATIDAFVQKTFCGKNGVSRDSLIWFKNWKSLKSVHALEHFHVMLYKPDQEFLKRITGGDVAMSEKLKR